MNIVLATGSARRHALFREFGLDFCIAESGFDETELMSLGLGPRETVETIAKGKLNHIQDKYPGSLVITADTIVYFDGSIIGKPKDCDDAFETLRALSGNIHEVYTGLAYSANGMVTVLSQVAAVEMKRLEDEEILSYIASKEAFGKAGAYNAGDRGGSFIKKIYGDLDTVLGLPMKLLTQELYKLKLIGFEGR